VTFVLQIGFKMDLHNATVAMRIHVMATPQKTETQSAGAATVEARHDPMDA
jgi:hypothetical protein